MASILIDVVKKPDPKFDYEDAKKVADTLVASLEPFCDKINIAGSIRRQKPLVKDIEIVCLPKKVFFQTELFGEGKLYVIPDFHKALREVTETVVKGNVDGRYCQIKLKSGIALDLFLPQPDDYYRQYAIRTGSGDYSRFKIAQGWRKKGWCGTQSGLRKISECYQDGKTWKCYNQEAELPPVWESEEHFFDWLGIKWIKPYERNI